MSGAIVRGAAMPTILALAMEKKGSAVARMVVVRILEMLLENCERVCRVVFRLNLTVWRIAFVSIYLSHLERAEKNLYTLAIVLFSVFVLCYRGCICQTVVVVSVSNRIIS